MCNHYEHLSADDLIGLRQHYELLGMSWSEAMADYLCRFNRPRDIYRKQKGPVLIVVNGEIKFEEMAWGMPASMPSRMGGDKLKRRVFVTKVGGNSRNHWKRWPAGAEVVSGARKYRGGRCLVPASAFAQPDGRTRKPVVERWFACADGKPFFFAGVWREWDGDHGTTKEPNEGRHRLYGFLTAEPNDVVNITPAARASPRC
jgi:putative SOS response-associated peptidase YedK